MASKYSIQTSIHIDATAKKIFDVLIDLNRFDEWNPFRTFDESVTSHVTQSKPGVGSTYDYQGKKIGKGRQLITAVNKPSTITSQMFFYRGDVVRDTVTVEYRLVEDSTGTVVTWFMEGERNLMGSFMGRVMGFDKMMGKSFATGLGQLKGLIESGNK